MSSAPEDFYDYVLYVDEAGDFGTRTTDNGSTDWFVIGGFVTARKNEAKMADWVKEIRQKAGTDPSSPELHYNKLDSNRRISAAAAVADLPLRSFVVMSHKANMRGHQNKRAAKVGGQSVFYNFCLRILLERATHAVARDSVKRFGEVRSLKIIIAETGGVRYEQTKRYLEKLRAQAIMGTTVLDAQVIHPKVAASWLLESVNAKNTAGCQVADVIVSSFYNAVNESGAFPMLQAPAMALARKVATRNRKTVNFGVQLLPWDKNIPERFRRLFRAFGYHWQR